MVDEKTIVMGTGKNRTYSNLLENPHAVFLIMEPGKTVTDWKGVRIYVEMKEHETSGQKIDQTRLARQLGERFRGQYRQVAALARAGK